MFSPYGAGNGLRCSLFMENDLTPSPSPDMRGEKQLGNIFAGLKSPLSGEI